MHPPAQAAGLHSCRDSHPLHLTPHLAPPYSTPPSPALPHPSWQIDVLSLQGFANLTVGTKLAQLLHDATTKITPKIRYRRPPRARRRRRSGPGRPPQEAEEGEQQPAPPDPKTDNDRELDSLLEAGFLELASDDEAPAARGGPSSSPLDADSAEEGEIEYSDSDLDGAAEDDIPGLGFMGLGFGIDFADVASNAQEDDDFADALVPAKLPPAARRALERDRARKRRRHLAEKGWDAFEVLLCLVWFTDVVCHVCRQRFQVLAALC